MKIPFVYMTVFGNLFTNVLSTGVDLKCRGGLTSLFTTCSDRCPQPLPLGICKKHEDKWQCVCKRFELETNEYTLEEAKCIQGVHMSGEQNHDCLNELCPPGFQDGGRILEERGEWQFYCSAREFGNTRESEYSISEAKHIYDVCNGPRKRDGHKACKRLCPINYQMGDCFLDQTHSMFRCGCSFSHKLRDWYGIQETKSIVRVCSSTVQNHRGCASLCPSGFNFGSCSSVGNDRLCVCRQQNHGVGAYTIPEAREMKKVCSQRIQDNEGCRYLCPLGYKYRGRCFNDGEHPECQCMRMDDHEQWITLKDANHDSVANRVSRQ